MSDCDLHVIEVKNIRIGRYLRSLYSKLVFIIQSAVWDKTKQIINPDSEQYMQRLHTCIHAYIHMHRQRNTYTQLSPKPAVLYVVPPQ